MPSSARAKPAKKQVPVEEGLFTWPSDRPQLIGSRCRTCGEVAFPRQDLCPQCCTESTEDILLSRRGVLNVFTIQRHRPPSPPYRGPEAFVPFGVGRIDLPEGVRVTSVLAGAPDRLKTGMEMELVVEKFSEDAEGNDIVSFKFRPVTDH